MDSSMTTPPISSCAKICMASTVGASFVSGVSVGLISKVFQGWNLEEDRPCANLFLPLFTASALFSAGLLGCEWICDERDDKVSQVAQGTINQAAGG